ncbi:hypothetical protein COLO4_06795 [Corchorus olitorius]|uniref:Uncharacterized protein n=1 Tax=Corchorus olitorius TaxID=93759 RepID=A0A1R3KLY5_9ROSI|nr:hypothetical protein COLO4_06795 [Corchorus olitorius]
MTYLQHARINDHKQWWNREKYEIVVKYFKETYKMVAKHIPYWLTRGGGLLVSQVVNSMTFQEYVQKEEMNFVLLFAGQNALLTGQTDILQLLKKELKNESP